MSICAYGRRGAVRENIESSVMDKTGQGLFAPIAGFAILIAAIVWMLMR
jgi:hypothetical protein